jgi:hypothetical protein
MMPRSKDLTAEIVAEIRRVLTRFSFADDIEIDPTNSQQVNQFLESRGADIYLLCTIGSWKDTISDEEVLSDLRDWLREGEQALRPDPSFVRAK